MNSEAALWTAYREAVEKEGRERDAAFLPLPTIECCGFKLRLLTIQDFISLELGGNAFVCGGAVTKVDILQLLSWLCVDSKKGITHFVRCCDELDTANKIEEFIQFQLFDMLGASEKPKKAPVMSWAASVVMAIAFETGWSEESILKMPMSRIGQYLRAIEVKNDPEAILFNPSDKVKADWLKNRSKE